MSRKYNTVHGRSPSRYPARLEKRGYKTTPVMPDLDALRRLQGVPKDEVEVVAI